MRRLPVRWRLTLAFAAVMAVVLAATGAFVYQRVASNLDRALDRSLRARAADVAALAQQSDSGLREARGAGASRRPAELAQLIDSSGRVLDHTPGLPSRSLMTSALLVAARRGAPVTSEVRLALDQPPIRLLAEPVHAQGQTLLVIVGQPLADRNRALGDLIDVLLLGGPAALGLASLAGYLLTGAALRPVEAMRRRAEAISTTSLRQRLAPTGSNDELGRLGCTLNEMLARVDESVIRERAFVSDASHELRSPLAMLRAELELIARERPTGTALQGAVLSAIQETDRLSQLTDDLLLLARADDRRLALNPAVVLVSELMDAAARRASDQQPRAAAEIVLDAPADVAVRVDRERIGQALDNLLANGLRYAKTRLEVSAHVHATSVELHVRDDGPGFPSPFLPHAWERFSRADAGRTEDGAGLGLAIVWTIVDLHGGRAGAANAPGGGADVWITLRRAAQRTNLAKSSIPAAPAPA